MVAAGSICDYRLRSPGCPEKEVRPGLDTRGTWHMQKTPPKTNSKRFQKGEGGKSNQWNQFPDLLEEKK